MRRLRLSMKFGRYTAHRRIQHASGLASRTLSPICRTPLYVASLFRFRTAARYAPTRSRAAAQITGQPRRSWTVEWGNAVHVHEPSGISVRILVEGSLWGSSSYETGGPYGPALRTIPRLRSEPHARMTESTPDSKPHQQTKRQQTIFWSQIGQNQAPATHCTSSSYHLRSSPQLLVQLRRRIAAIKGANPRHPQKQLQHHQTPWRSTGSSRRSSRRRSPSSRPPPRRRASQNCPRTSRAVRTGAQIKFRGCSRQPRGRSVASTPSTRRLHDGAALRRSDCAISLARPRRRRETTLRRCTRLTGS